MWRRTLSSIHTPLAPLLRNIHRIGIATTQENLLLAKKVEQGDLAARKEMIEKNIALVVFMAKRVTSALFTIDDRVSAGMKGLIQAVDKFERDRGYTFATYAKSAIRQEMLNMMMDEGSPIPLPRYTYEKKRRPKGQAAKALDLITSATFSLPSEEVLDTEMYQKMEVEEILSALPEEDQELVRRKYMEGQTYDEIAEDVHVKKDAVRHRVQKAMEILRAVA